MVIGAGAAVFTGGGMNHFVSNGVIPLPARLR